jgi:endonuclease/exonuclease/phosphatase family metal-dependent hydrolase
MKLNLLLLSAALAFTSAVDTFGQTSLRMMTYNTLNFPFGVMPSRQDTLKKIIDYVRPDLVMFQELRTAAGLELLLDAFEDLPDPYAASTFVPNQSNQFGGTSLQQAIIYNTKYLGLAEESLVITDLRDINIYKMYLNDDDLANGLDTTYFYVYVAHFKASSGAQDEQDRLEMAEIFVDALNDIPSNSYVLFGGDFNLYSSTEPAYQALLSSQNNVVLEDPISAPGNWSSSSYPFRQVHTQSTRIEIIFEDGSPSGVDDRFDFILMSSNFRSAQSPFRYTTGSYKALGNTGNCYNLNITDCTNNPVPFNVLRAMYYFSDHLPVVMDLELDYDLSTNETASAKHINAFYNAGRDVYLNHNLPLGNYHLDIFDLNGRMVSSRTLRNGENTTLQELPKAVYIAVLFDAKRTAIVDRKKLVLR